MKKKVKSVGELRERNKEFLTRANEFGEKAGNHFSTLFLQRLKNVREVRLWVVEWALLVVLVFLLAVVQIFWYDGSYETAAFVEGGEYTEATLGDVKSMNPLYAATSSEKTLARLLFANLTSPDNTGQIGMGLAKSVEHDETGKVWTVKLRDGLRWSDGEPITADDIVYTVNLINDESAKTTISADFSRIEMKQTDDKTVVFTLPSVYLDFIDTLEFPLLPSHILKDVSPALVYEDAFSSNPVSSGPFVFKALQPGGGVNKCLQTVYMQRNDNYYGGKTKLANFNLQSFENTEAIVEAMRNMTVTATAEVIDAGDLKLNRRTKLTNGGVYAFLNTQSQVLKKTEVRQAIRKGIDMSKVREGMEEMRKLDYPFLKSQEEGLNYPDLAKYDKEEAKKQLLENKFIYDEDGKLTDESGAEVRLRVAVRKREPIQSATQRFVEQLKELGFAVELNVFDDAQPNANFFAQVLRPRDYDILFYEIDLGVSADPFVYYSSTQANSNGWNFSNYNSALADDALLTARTTMDEELRTSKLNAFLQRWMNEVPAIGVYQSVMDYYSQEGVRFFADDANFTDALDRFYDVKYWATVQGNVMQTP